MTTYILVKAHCCREWEVVLGEKVGRCGLCGERPTIELEGVYERLEVP